MSLPSVASDKVTLAKGCGSCIKAKRKCSRTLPRCQRCGDRNISCRYQNQPGSCGDQSTSSAYVNRTGNAVSNCTNVNIKIIGSTQQRIGPPQLYSIRTRRPIDSLFLRAPSVILPMDPKTISYLKCHLQSFPASFVQTQGTIFIHPQLYPAGLPPTLRAVLQLCKMHIETATENRHLLAPAISDFTRKLLSSISSTCTFIGKLAFLQSLILLQIITLLFPTTDVIRAQAEARELLVRSWIHEVYNSVPSSLPSSLTPHQAWVIAESTRRTIHAAHMIVGCQSVLATGTFTLTLFVEALPLDRHDRRWTYREQDSLCSPDSANKRADLISYRELVDLWDRGEIKVSSLFVELLIAACKGIDEVRMATQETASNQIQEGF